MITIVLYMGGEARTIDSTEDELLNFKQAMARGDIYTFEAKYYGKMLTVNAGRVDFLEWSNKTYGAWG
jgi:hypothetical protein